MATTFKTKFKINSSALCMVFLYCLQIVLGKQTNMTCEVTYGYYQFNYVFYGMNASKNNFQFFFNNKWQTGGEDTMVNCDNLSCQLNFFSPVRVYDDASIEFFLQTKTNQSGLLATQNVTEFFSMEEEKLLKTWSEKSNAYYCHKQPAIENMNLVSMSQTKIKIHWTYYAYYIERIKTDNIHVVIYKMQENEKLKSIYVNSSLMCDREHCEYVLEKLKPCHSYKICIRVKIYNDITVKCHEDRTLCRASVVATKDVLILSVTATIIISAAVIAAYYCRKVWQKNHFHHYESIKLNTHSSITRRNHGMKNRPLPPQPPLPQSSLSSPQPSLLTQPPPSQSTAEAMVYGSNGDSSYKEKNILPEANIQIFNIKNKKTDLT